MSQYTIFHHSLERFHVLRDCFSEIERQQLQLENFVQNSSQINSNDTLPTQLSPSQFDLSALSLDQMKVLNFINHRVLTGVNNNMDLLIFEDVPLIFVDYLRFFYSISFATMQF